MIERHTGRKVRQQLEDFPVVALLGPRQAGKTTLARTIASERPSVYLDLESTAGRARLAEPRLYLDQHIGELIVLDEVQHMPGIFRELRGVIDDARFSGHPADATRFLILGSASGDLLRQSGESLAGRIAYCELAPFSLSEVEGRISAERLWLRGGFPGSALVTTESKSVAWRESFIRTFLERDLREITPRIPSETVRRLWTMLAHANGSLLNAAELARALAIDGKTVSRYIDLLSDLFMVFRLPPWHASTRKRLVRSPRVFICDSGIVHSLLGIDSYDALLSHPVAGASWEGFVIQQVRSVLPQQARTHFYRSAGGAEVDLVIEMPQGERWAVEIKRGLTPKIGRGFREACGELRPSRRFVVYSGRERFPVDAEVEAVGVAELLRELARNRK